MASRCRSCEPAGFRAPFHVHLRGADLFDGEARTIAALIARGDTAALGELKTRGTSFDVAGRRDDTLLTFTIFYWPVQVPLLLELGADPDFGAGVGTGPLYRAVEQGRADVVAMLLQAGARPDIVDQQGTPVIFHTLKVIDKSGFSALVHAGADLTGRDDRGYTLLMATVYYRQWRDASRLIEKGLDPKAVGKFGDTIEDLLNRMRLEPEELADPAYQALLAQLRTAGIEIRQET